MVETFDTVVVGGGPSGATAAADLAGQGHAVLLLDKAGRIKPCGGAIPPRLLREFDVPESLLCAKVNGARMISPKAKQVHMPINGWVGMVDREHFDEWLRHRAVERGAERRTGKFERVDRDKDGTAIVVYSEHGQQKKIRARTVIGADGAREGEIRFCVSRNRPRTCRWSGGFRSGIVRCGLRQCLLARFLCLGVPARRYGEHRHRFDAERVCAERLGGGAAGAYGPGWRGDLAAGRRALAAQTTEKMG
jgi:hypothetical protein